MHRIKLLKRALIAIILLADAPNIVRAAELPIGENTYGDADGCQTFVLGDTKTDSYTYLDAKRVYGWEQFCGYENIVDMQNDKWVAKLRCEGGNGEYSMTAAIQKTDNKITFTVIETGRTKELFVCLSSGKQQVAGRLAREEPLDEDRLSTDAEALFREAVGSAETAGGV